MPRTGSNPSNEISIYKGDLTDRCVVDQVKNLKEAFPALTPSFYNILYDRAKANGFTDQRLKDAISHTIDTCLYPTPAIANIISWDKTVKVFTHDEMLKRAFELGPIYQPADGRPKIPTIWDEYERVKLKGRSKPVWIHIDDIKQYNITDEE